MADYIKKIEYLVDFTVLLGKNNGPYSKVACAVENSYLLYLLMDAFQLSFQKPFKTKTLKKPA